MKAPHSDLRRLYANNTHAQRRVRVENQPGKRIDITEDFQIVEAKDCRKRILKSGARAPLDRRRALTAWAMNEIVGFHGHDVPTAGCEY